MCVRVGGGGGGGGVRRGGGVNNYRQYIGCWPVLKCSINRAGISENEPSDMHTKRRFRSACAFVQSDQNLHWAHFG